MVETEIERKEDKDGERDRPWKSSVEVHSLVDPVAISGVPEYSAEIPREGRASQRERMDIALRKTKNEQKRNERDPGEPCLPRLQRSRNGKKCDLKDCGEYNQTQVAG